MEPEVHPIDMLVDLVLQGEMDPWDIDIASLAQRFLEEVRNMSKLNLRLSGKTLLTSAILLRMKSEHLMPEENGHDGYEEYSWEDAYNDVSYDVDVPPLPTPLRRRAERRVTLFELVEALQRALNEEIIRKNFPPQPRAKPKLIIKVDEETIREKILTLYDRLLELAQHCEVIRFHELLREHSRRHVVELLLYLLYLDSQGKLTVWQEELFGEIFITLR
jgi:segregation and condensation protein A